jgi:hypothetical protein
MTDRALYLPSTIEVALLKDHIFEYFSHPPKSPDGRRIPRTLSELLIASGFSHWTDARVRRWFRSNYQRFIPPDAVAPAFPPSWITEGPPAPGPLAYPLVLPDFFAGYPLPPRLRCVFTQMPGYPELPPPDAPPRALCAALSALARHARNLPQLPNHDSISEALEVDILFCFRRLGAAAGRVALDDGAPVVEVAAFPVLTVPAGLARVECALNCLGEERVFATSDERRGLREITRGSLSAPIDFDTKVTSIVYDESLLWVAGDFRVVALDIERLQERDLLYVGDPQMLEDAPVAASGLAVWTGRVVLAHGRRLTFWPRDGSPEVPGREEAGVVRRASVI